MGPYTPSIPEPRAANYIHSVFEDAGLSVREQNYQYGACHRVTNGLATAPGNTGNASVYYMVLSPRYRPEHAGADDNASAVAVMLGTGRSITASRPEVPRPVCCLHTRGPPAHWTGDQGSRIFVRSCQNNGDSVLGAIILEMVGYTAPRQRYPFLPRWPGYPAEGNFIGVIGNWRSWRFGREVVRGFRKNRDLPAEALFLPFDGWILPDTRLSDHASFWDAGLPALMVTDTAFFRNPNYHLASDTIDTLDFAFMAQLVRSLELALLDLPLCPRVRIGGAGSLCSEMGLRPRPEGLLAQPINPSTREMAGR